MLLLSAAQTHLKTQGHGCIQSFQMCRASNTPDFSALQTAATLICVQFLPHLRKALRHCFIHVCFYVHIGLHLKPPSTVQMTFHFTTKKSPLLRLKQIPAGAAFPPTQGNRSRASTSNDTNEKAGISLPTYIHRDDFRNKIRPERRGAEQ